MTEVLPPRRLGRATLARQLLLARAPLTVTEAVDRLAGLQAQEPGPPQVGLWSRVDGFAVTDLNAALHDRTVVRATLMRGTLHLVTAARYAALRASLQPMLVATGLRVLADRGDGLDPDAVPAVARDLLAGRPQTFDELRSRLQEAFPAANDRALGYVTRTRVPLVMVPTTDPNGFPRDAAFALAEEWLDAPLAANGGLGPLLLAYLAAFGPASAADAQTWSGCNGTHEALDALRPRLRTFRDDRGRELFDLPGAPRPDADHPAPVRFLPEFDNLVLAHHDRRRIVPDEHRPYLVTRNLRVRATFLHDGLVAGTWKADRKRRLAALDVTPFAALPPAAVDELTREGEALLGFLAPASTAYEVRVHPPGPPG